MFLRDPRHRGRRFLLLATTLVATLAGVGGYALRGTANRAGALTAVPAPPAAPSTAGAGGAGVARALQDAYVSVLERVRPSVVEISTAAGLGSGVVYDDKGHIVTNAHVVGDARRLRVTLADGRTADATLVGTYPPDDLAVIAVGGDGHPTPARFADSSKVKVGEITLAIGNPLGLASSVTDGIVSFNGRTVSEGDGVVLPSTIQTSAPINPGNSGGALVDLDGEVIGIPTLAAADAQFGGAAPGIGFAIPSNTVTRIADQLVETGMVTSSGRAALGISATTASTPFGQPVGVLIRAVEPQGAAAAAGLLPGDIIAAVDGHPTPDQATLQEILAGLEPGTGATVDVLRAGKTPGRSTSPWAPCDAHGDDAGGGMPPAHLPVRLPCGG